MNARDEARANATRAAADAARGQSDVTEMARLWDGLDALQSTPGYADLLGGPSWRERLVAAHGRWRHASKLIVWPAIPTALAAGLAIYAMRPAPSLYETAGGRQRIALSDHSTVDLGPSSRLSFETKDGRRLATLNGRATFQVAHDKAHPFVIRVGDAQVQVVGTQFTLDYRQPCTQLSVIEGVVTLRTPSGSLRRLQAGEEAVSVDGGKSYRSCIAAAGKAALRWSYIDVPLSTIVRDIQPFYPRKIVLASPELAAERLTTSFRLTDLDTVIETLPAMIDARATRAAAGTITIRRRAGEPGNTAVSG